jgi:hypothetical protein
VKLNLYIKKKMLSFSFLSILNIDISLNGNQQGSEFESCILAQTVQFKSDQNHYKINHYKLLPRKATGIGVCVFLKN